MNAVTFTSRAAAALVAAVAGFSSYRHIYDVAAHAGEHHGVAAVLPLAIDGLIVVGTMAILEDRRASRHPRQSARFALGFGVLATLAANIASAQPTWTARMVAAVPAISFLIAVEVLARTGKPRVGNSAPSAGFPTPASGKIETGLSTEYTDVPASGKIEPASSSGNVITGTPAMIKPATAPNGVSRKAPARQSSADRVRQAVARTPEATPAQIAARLKVSERTVTRYWPAPADDTVSSGNGHKPGVVTLS